MTVGIFTHEKFSAGNSLSLLSALSGIPEEMLANTTEDLGKYFTKCSQFIIKDKNGWRGGEVPESLTIMDKVCTIPADLNFQLFGQKILLGQAMKKGSLQAIPDAIAIYLAPQVFGSNWFEADNIAELREEVLKLPINAVYPIADFFLSLYPEQPNNVQID